MIPAMATGRVASAMTQVPCGRVRSTSSRVRIFSPARDLRTTMRFSATADVYDRYRPDYPAAVFDWIVAAAQLQPAARVVDLGCGTGISARQLASRGYRVTGVDPNARMLGYARGYEAGAHGPF